MRVARLGAVDYLNARPLVYGLELRNDLFSLRFDVPSKCAALLHEGSIDVGMIPSIEYQRGRDYRIVPGVGIISDGPVASVALFARTPLQQIRSIAADTSSRTSYALLRILCVECFGIDPDFQPMPPDADAMLRRCDAALLIGDPALFLDHEASRGRENRSRRAVDVADRSSVRVGVLGRSPRRLVAGCRERAHRPRGTPALPDRTRSPRRTAAPSARSAASRT